MSQRPTSRLWSAAFIATLGSQFFSALADNALIFAALAVVHRQSYPAWAGPLLQEFFIVTYVVLAPFVGAFADAQPKGRAMLWANAVKLAGTLAMCLEVNPFLSYAVVGAGAAAYSPAKYGISYRQRFWSRPIPGWNRRPLQRFCWAPWWAAHWRIGASTAHSSSWRPAIALRCSEHC
jgi:hypothetical protein